MVKPYQRSRSMARKVRNTPGNRNTIIYRRRRPKKAHCALCGAVLGGVPANRPMVTKNTPKSMKRPDRQYGGRVCPNCLRKALLDEVNSM